MNLPIDPARYIRAGVQSIRRTSAQRCCEGSGWKIRAGAVNHRGRVYCPLCRERVACRPAGDGVVELAYHQGRRP